MTVPDKPSGEPIAITVSPTKMLSLLPNCRVGAEVTSIFKTAKSYEASLPINFAGYFLPFDNSTVIFPRVDDFTT